MNATMIIIKKVIKYDESYTDKLIVGNVKQKLNKSTLNTVDKIL